VDVDAVCIDGVPHTWFYNVLQVQYGEETSYDGTHANRRLSQSGTRFKARGM